MRGDGPFVFTQVTNGIGVDDDRVTRDHVRGKATRDSPAARAIRRARSADAPVVALLLEGRDPIVDRRGRLPRV